MNIHVLNRKEEFLTIIHNDNELGGVLSFNLIEDLAELDTLDFEVSGNVEGIEHLAEGNYILTQNLAGNWKQFVITRARDAHGVGISKIVESEECISELGDDDNLIEYSGKEINLSTAVKELLAGTRYTVGTVETPLIAPQLEKSTMYSSKLSVLKQLAAAAGLNLFLEITVNGNNEIVKTVHLKEKNKEEGKRFEFDSDLGAIERTVDASGLKTAIRPLGAALEQTEEDEAAGKPLEYVTIKDVVWYKSEGKPFDKPAGQELLIDPEATEKYGILGTDGSMKPKVIVMQFDDITDPEVLAVKAWAELDKLTKPQTNYAFTATDLTQHMNKLGEGEKPVEVGDVCYAIDDSVQPPIVTEVVIRRIEGNPDQKDSMKVEIGIPETTLVDGGTGSGGSVGVGGGSGGSGGGSISTGDLTAIKASINELKANKAEIKDLEATNATVKNLTAEVAKIGQLEVDIANLGEAVIGKADIGTLNAVDAKIDQLKVEVAYIKDLEVERARIEKLEVHKATIEELIAGNISADNIKAGTITADSAIVASLNASKITAGTLDASLITVVNLSADSITTGTLDAAKITVKNLNADSIIAGTIDASKIKVTNLSADSITTGTLDASKITVLNLSAGSITTGELDAAKVTVKNLNASSITAGTIDANLLDVINIDASNINTGTLDASKVTVSNMSAGAITGGTLDAAKITVLNLSASSITTGTLDASKFTVKNLNAGSINAGELDANRVTIKNLRADSIVAGSITVQGENLIHNTDFSNGTESWKFASGWSIDDTFTFEGVNSAKIIQTGLATANYRSIQSERIPIEVGQTMVASCYLYSDDISTIDSGAGIQFEFWESETATTRLGYIGGINHTPIASDSWERRLHSATCNVEGTKFVSIRIQLNKNGRLWIAKPMLSKGSIASVWKLHIDELISDGAIDNDKLAGDSVTSDKLVLDEIFASTAFVEKFEAVEISAKQITSDKISSQFLDIEGIISFQKNPEAFGDDMKDNFIFDTTSDKTFINGGALYANSVTAEKINVKGLKVTNAGNAVTFQVLDKQSADASNGKYQEGDVIITGTIESTNYDPSANTGYRIDKDGNVDINNATIRGDVILPNAGITDSPVGNGSDSDLELAQYNHRNFLLSPMIVTDPLDQAYSSFEVAPPVGAVLCSYNPHKGTVKAGTDSPTLSWAVINLAELYKNTNDPRALDRVNKAASYMISIMQSTNFYGSDFKYIPNEVTIVDGTWTPKTNMFHIRNQSLAAFALLHAYEVTQNSSYKANAEALMDATATWYQNVDTRCDRAEIPAYMKGGIYNVVINSGDYFRPDWNIFSNTSSDTMIMLADKYIELFGDATRKDAEKLSYTVSGFRPRIKSYLTTNMSKDIIASTGHKLLYNFAYDDGSGVPVHMNYDFHNDVWGKDQWFTTDLECWGIRTFALCGLTDTAVDLVNKLYAMRSSSYTDLVLLFDRYNADGSPFDEEASVDFTGLLYGIHSLLKEYSVVSKCNEQLLLNTCIDTQIKSAIPVEDGSYYWNTFLNSQSVTENKTLGEILYYTRGLGAFDLLNKARAAGVPSSPVRFWAGAEYAKRNEAPFQVLQDGTVKATRGEFGGTFTGELSIGNIRISDTNYSEASITVHTNNFSQKVLEFNEKVAFIGTNLKLGSETSPSLEFDSISRTFNFNNSAVHIVGNKSKVSFPADGSSTIMKTGYNGNSGYYECTTKYENGSYVQQHNGVVDKDVNAPDFEFRRTEGDTTVKVRGAVDVTNEVVVGSVKIVNRSKNGKKRIDFVVV